MVFYYDYETNEKICRSALYFKSTSESKTLYFLFEKTQEIHLSCFSCIIQKKKKKSSPRLSSVLVRIRLGLFQFDLLFQISWHPIFERKKNIITSFSGKFLSRRSILSFIIYDNFTSTTTIHAIKTFLHDEKNKSKSLLF